MGDGAMAANGYTRPPPDDSFDGTHAIAPDHIGGENTPGTPISPATADCAAILKSVGLPPPTQRGAIAGALYGSGCAAIKIFVAAVANAPALSRTQLADGLALAGQLYLSFPPGPMNVTSAANPTGGQFYRGARWATSCQCWRLIDKTFRPGA
ncbi:MAG: hypothetical protein JWM31_1008, partial [Solirubrobacterales bacterium]|nr:hypothetical protein [Solirubrobacterales bacterium]